MTGMTYELSREHEEFRRSVREFAAGGDRAARRAVGPRPPLPGRRRAADGQARACSGLTSPEEYGGAGEDGDFTSLCVAIEEIGRVDQSMGITLEAAVGLGINPILTYGTEEQKQSWLPDLVAGAGARRLRPDRARRGLRRRRDQDQGRARRRRVGRQRRQAVHHQLRLRDHQRGHGHRAHRHRRERRQGRDQHDPGADRHAGFTVEPAYDKLGWHASDTHPLTFEDVPRARGQPARRARPRLRPVPRHPRRRPGRDRGARGRLHPGLPRPERRVRRRPADLRRPDRPQAGRRLPDRRPRGDAAREPAAHLPRRRDEGRRRAGQGVQAGRRRSPSSTPPSPRSPPPGSRPRSSAATASWRSTPSRGFYRDAKVLEIGEGTSEVQRMLIARGLGLPVE